jgi:hypothetical protein
VQGTHTLTRNPGGVLNVPAVILVLLMTALLVTGIKESARFNNIIVIVKVAIVFLVIGFGFMFVDTANWQPFIPPPRAPGRFGWNGIVRAAGVVFFAYIGFDAVSTAAQEAKNPQRDMPIGMLGSLAFCTVLYILMSLVMTGLAPYSELNVPHPVDVALARVPSLSWLNILVDIAAIAGLASVVLVMLMGQPRIFFSMARDGLLPAGVRKDPPEVPDAVRHHDPLRRRGGDRVRLLPDRAARRAGVDRYALRLRRRERGRADAALQAPGAGAPVPHAAGSARAVAGHPGLRLPDVRPADRHVAPPHGLAGARSGDLLHVRQVALEDRPRDGRRRHRRPLIDPFAPARPRARRTGPPGRRPRPGGPRAFHPMLARPVPPPQSATRPR